MIKASDAKKISDKANIKLSTARVLRLLESNITKHARLGLRESSEYFISRNTMSLRDIEKFLKKEGYKVFVRESFREGNFYLRVKW